MNRFSRLVHALAPAGLDRVSHEIDALEQASSGGRDEAAAAAAALGAVADEVAAARRCVGRLLEVREREVKVRASLAGPGGPRVSSESVVLEGPPSARLRVQRVSVGVPFATPFGRTLGLEVNASASADVRQLWERLLAQERASDDVLRSEPTTVLECGPAEVSRVAHDVDRATLRVVLPHAGISSARASGASPRGVVAVPKFTYHFSARKLRNFGHWVLDCLPQVVALRALAPDATLLLPDALKGFHRRTLALLGVPEDQIVAWDGSPVTAERVLVLEGDGRVGGGRPLASLVALRDILATAVSGQGRRRLYVSRRDAKPHRRWVDNEPEVERVFERWGFEVLCMSECPLERQVELFSDAQIVAGVSGAGLTNLVFAPPGTHAVVLVTDGLMRWYADEGQSRALWLDGTGVRELSALGDSPRFYGHVAAAFGQTSHTFIGGDLLPLESLDRFVGQVVARVEGQ